MFAFLRSFRGQENCSKKVRKVFVRECYSLYPKEKVRNGEFMLVYHLHRQTGLGRFGQMVSKFLYWENSIRDWHLPDLQKSLPFTKKFA